MKYLLDTGMTDRFTKGSDIGPQNITSMDSCVTSYTFDLFGKWSVAICFNMAASLLSCT